MKVITSETLIEEGRKIQLELILKSLSKEQLAEIIAHSPIAQQVLAERDAKVRAAERATALAQLAEREAEIRAAERAAALAQLAEREAEIRAAERAAAHHQTLLQQITQILVIQLQADGDTWQARLAPLSNEQLKQLSEAALRVPTLAAFEAEFAKMVSDKGRLR